MNIKMGRINYEITNSDVFCFNGVVWSLITQYELINYGKCSPTLSKTKANYLLKAGVMYFIKEVKGIKYYKIKE